MEQLWNVNENLEAESLLSQSMHGSLMASLVGKEVKAVGNIVSLPEEGNVELGYSIPKAANVTVSVFNELGTLVREIEMGTLEASNQTLTWDGKNNNGDRLSAGEYSFTITAVDVEGNAITASPIVRGQISGVRFVDGYPILLINNQEISPENVIEILQP